jgi:hypothetical protein
MRSYEIECKTYNRGAPYLKGSMHIATGYFSVFDKDAARYLILMEDLHNRTDNMHVGNCAIGLIDQVLDNDGKVIKSEIGTSVCAFE